MTTRLRIGEDLTKFVNATRNHQKLHYFQKIAVSTLLLSANFSSVGELRDFCDCY